MSTLINLVGTRLEIQEHLHNGNLAAARNLITNRMLAPWRMAKWLTPAQQAALAAPLPNEPMAQPKREVTQLALELV
ncbi:hypothetical protein [Herpetosiphon sp. NSE202]|uniref:hypothetical protein n=1 Tax=Herpetosiphon sp. NSE202 TaxID=3351349 RepID=UPI003637A7E8